MKPPQDVVLPIPTELDDPKGELSGVIKYLDRLNIAITRFTRSAVVRTKPESGVLLQSPAGYIYELRVSDAGVLSTVVKYHP